LPAESLYIRLNGSTDFPLHGSSSFGLKGGFQCLYLDGWQSYDTSFTPELEGLDMRAFTVSLAFFPDLPIQQNLITAGKSLRWFALTLRPVTREGGRRARRHPRFQWDTEGDFAGKKEDPLDGPGEFYLRAEFDNFAASHVVESCSTPIYLPWGAWHSVVAAVSREEVLVLVDGKVLADPIPRPPMIGRPPLGDRAFGFTNPGGGGRW